VIDEFDRFTLGPDDIHLLRADLGLPATGWHPLDLPVRWATDVERNQARERTWQRLHRTGMARRDRLAADVEQALRVAAHPESGLTAFAALDRNGSILRARAVIGQGVGLILSQDEQNGPVRFEYRSAAAVFAHLIDLIGVVDPHPDPAAVVASSAEDAEMSFTERADGRDVAGRQRDRAVWAEPRLRVGAFAGFAAERWAPELKWFDTRRGRRMVYRQGAAVLVSEPADNRVIYRRLVSDLAALRE